MEGCKYIMKEGIRNVLDRPTSEGSARILMRSGVMAEEEGAITQGYRTLLSRR